LAGWIHELQRRLTRKLEKLRWVPGKEMLHARHFTAKAMQMA